MNERKKERKKKRDRKKVTVSLSSTPPGKLNFFTCAPWISKSMGDEVHSYFLYFDW